MVDFSTADSALIAEGHGHAVTDLRTAAPTAAGFSETWYSDESGFGHDCAKHQEVPKEQWSPSCGTFRPVTVALGVPPEVKVERAS